MNKMKDSGVEWLGKIDSRFSVQTVRSLFSIKKDIIGHDPNTVLSITQNGIKVKNISENNGQMASSYAHYQIVNPGDFAMNHMDLLTGGIGISNYQGVTSPDYRVFTLKAYNMNPYYFLYVFDSYYKNRFFYAFGQGAAHMGRWRLPAQNFYSMQIPVAPIELQNQIVEILNIKCSQVDTLITKVESQIDKLKQYKQNLITETVTKGLNPAVPLKDSGVEWIGEIPEEWELIRFKDKWKNVKEIAGDSSDEYERLALTLNGVIKRAKDDSDGLQPKAFDGYQILRGNNFVFKMIDLQNINTSRVGLSPYTGLVSPAYIRFAPKNTAQHSKFTYYFLMSMYYNCVYNNLAGDGVRSALNASDMGSFYIPWPNEATQLEIATYLDRKCSMIDRLITLKQSKIEKLNQYKKSLIYEYVTGKKEVSHG